ncbi:SDR family NAD(P)-dependent oxidoreductase [Oricola cellulosilytica]|uniref:SDR family oxidoreductase n=1 Tax=Oricola cellulosilytica TaxID=1429082 RepID=A0A4R0PEB7_9HYPH|nr:SDR family oxidoreductase [Oricola cellulosilytica]TCD15103.1 SDR family oxidoreductase [Oricola cellulosilytica]
MTKLPKPPSLRLDGKRALVTGASSGIGLGCAVALAEAGAHVVMAARGRAKLDSAVDAIRDAGHNAEALVLDVADIDATAERVPEHGPFDILVNSAGIARHSPALETDPEDYDAVMRVNVRGAYFVSVAAARGMIEAGKGGSIIQISSQMAHVGGPERAVYCASKHAVEGFVKSMAIEWGAYGIRVNTICPTFIRTPLTEPTFADPDRVRWIEEKIKLGRVGEIEDIMGATVFLASEASALVTGTSLRIDGGWTAG